ncbi:hypothetical protein [Chryseobacterium jejuense]|uniref:hypothetical protein n=1 Tax=Chryseobacterium jejuense TaxID=445960 RepID=UPI001AE485B1|nr:hypothetical protein [Chryseobacterium jejuense]MBP2615976.1 hypothetical protein [Chryseobacterium jejuense]
MMKTLSLLLLFGAVIHVTSQIGINTPQPTETLDVNGSVRIRNIKQTGPNASAKDSIVVFDKGGVLKRATAFQIITQGNGLTSVVTASPLTGNGTASNPVILGQNGASNGQLLQWNGTTWIPVSASALGTIALNLGTSGNDINILNSPASLGESIKLNVPDASTTARGVVTTSNQSFTGTKMFSAVGINTSTPNASSRLDVNGNFKLGSTGTVNKNVINFSTSVNNLISSGDSTFLTGAFNSSGILDVNVTIPAANRPTSTQAIVSVSPNFDLPGAVSIASARLTSSSNVRIRFMNTDRNNAQTISGTLFITISEF